MFGKTRQCSYCYRVIELDDKELCIFEDCPMKNMKRFHRKAWFTFLVIATLVVLFWFMLIMGLAAIAGESNCVAVRDYDQRQACIAFERGQKEACTSIRNYDERQLCRIRADNQNRFKRALGR